MAQLFANYQALQLLTHSRWLCLRWNSVVHKSAVLFFFFNFLSPSLCLCCSCLGDRVRGSRPGQRQSEAGGEFTLDTLHVFITFRPLGYGWARAAGLRKSLCMWLAVKKQLSWRQENQESCVPNHILLMSIHTCSTLRCSTVIVWCTDVGSVVPNCFARCRLTAASSSSVTTLLMANCSQMAATAQMKCYHT